jgi:hypothetical protein
MIFSCRQTGQIAGPECGAELHHFFAIIKSSMISMVLGLVVAPADLNCFTVNRMGAVAPEICKPMQYLPHFRRRDGEKSSP